MISDIASYVTQSIGVRPNLILLHAGTNDIDLERDVAGAPARLAALVDQLLQRCPDATVLVAQIIGAKSADLQARLDTYNAAVATLINSRVRSGKHVALVDMGRLLDPSKDLADNKHPNDAGYAKMAQAWYAAIEVAEEKEWFGDPLKPEVTVGVGLNQDSDNGGSSGNPNCDGPRWIKQESIASIRTWEERGLIFAGYPGAKPENIIFADVTGDGIDDYLLVADDGSIRCWQGTGSGFTSLGVIAPGPAGVKGHQVRFADIDGDGLADYISVYDGGSARAWKNLGKVGSSDGSPKWKELGTIVENNVDGSEVQFIDIDRDGFADYVVVISSKLFGFVKNTGRAGKWGDPTLIATDVNGPHGGTIPSEYLKGAIDGHKVRLADVSGRGFADMLVMYDGGSVEYHRNRGNIGFNNTPKWEKIGVIATGVGVSRDLVRWARLDADRRADYLVLGTNGSVTAYWNSGRFPHDYAEGVRFADLNGDGRDDLLWLHDDGSVDAWLNQGANANSRWRSIGRIAKSPKDATRSNVVFADIDGDGRADYLIRYNGGAVKAFKNNGNLSPDGGNWVDLGTISPGVGAEGRKLQFADVDGDGRSDLLVVFDGGAVDAYLNTGVSGNMFKKLGTIAGGASGATGERVRFADIDGDGTADYVITWQGGSVEFFRNNGNLEREASQPSWEDRGVIAAGVMDQGIVLFGDLDGDGRADYLNVRDTGAVDAYINNCAHAGGPQPEDGPPSLIADKEKFCAIVNDDGKLSQTTDAWNAYGMDRQVEGFTSIIAPWKSNVQQALLTYYSEGIRGEISGLPCNGTGQCTFVRNSDVCLSHPDLTWILTATTNFNNLMADIRRIVLEVHGLVGDRTAKIVEDFYPEAEGGDDISAGLGMVNGLLTIVGAVVPGATAAAGLVGFFSSLMSLMTETAEDQTFSTYADVSNDLAVSVTNMARAIGNYATQILVETPIRTGKAYVSSDYGLPKILAGGAFAQKRDVPNLPEALFGAFISPVIDYIWNQQQVVLIKVDQKSLGYNPCPNRGGRISGISNDAIWCDSNGVAHVLIVWPVQGKFGNLARSAATLAVNGIEKLGNYSLDIEMVRASSDRSQVARGFRPDTNDAEYTREQILNGDLTDPGSLVSFTTPVCDIRNIDSANLGCDRDNPYPDLVGCHPDLCRFRTVVFEQCINIDGWPYRKPRECNCIDPICDFFTCLPI